MCARQKQTTSAFAIICKLGTKSFTLIDTLDPYYSFVLYLQLEIFSLIFVD